jgi:RNA polymerase sigma-70 factor (ECF subfamily)
MGERVFDDAHDQALMAGIARGDTQAFEELYQAYAKGLGHFLFRMCFDPAKAEDGLQEVFLRVWRSASRWRGEGKVSTFLFQIAKNVGLDLRERVLRERSGATFETDSEAPESRAAPEPTADDLGPAGRAEDSELRGLVRRAIEALPPEQRVVLHLSQIEGLTLREAAELLQTPLGTVKSRFAAAAQTLRRRLARHVEGRNREPHHG